MKINNKIMIVLMVVALAATINAQRRPDWGFGITLGDPTGLTAKMNTAGNNAWNFTLGSSYFGEIRFGVDYLWYFDAFNSRNVGLHAGFGGVLGFGESRSVIFKKHDDDFFIRDDEVGLGVRGVVGIDFYPDSSPFEIFVEMGPLIGLVPETGSAIDVAAGFRFYP